MSEITANIFARSHLRIIEIIPTMESTPRTIKESIANPEDSGVLNGDAQNPMCAIAPFRFQKHRAIIHESQPHKRSNLLDTNAP